MVGLRGVGKTVLLERMRADAEADGFVTVKVEASEERSLPGVLAPQLRLALLKLSTLEKGKQLARRALGVLGAFASKIKFTYADVEVGLDVDPVPGVADNGDLQSDLRGLLVSAAEAAQAAGTGLAMFIDELQYVPEDQLDSLLSALHACSQRPLPIVLVAAGLPQLRGKLGKAKSYAERMFDFPEIGSLSPTDARAAIERPAQEQGVVFEPEALNSIIDDTKGYPYFLQAWGKQCWNMAERSPIGARDVERAKQLAIAELDAGFFGVRFDRLTPFERVYCRALAELGPGPYGSGEVATLLNRKVTSLGPVRSALISKGMIWSPQHGQVTFTVPLFDEYLRRIMPAFERPGLT